MDDDVLGFEGADALLRAWSQGLRPDPDLTVSQWADRHRWLSSRASAEPGRYRTARTPYMREIMDHLSPASPVQRVVFMKAAQVGATEAGNCFVGFVMHHAPGPMLAVQPTVELAKRNSRQRIDPLIDDVPGLRERVKPARSRDADNTILSRAFAGGISSGAPDRSRFESHRRDSSPRQTETCFLCNLVGCLGMRIRTVYGPSYRGMKRFRRHSGVMDSLIDRQFRASHRSALRKFFRNAEKVRPRGPHDGRKT